MPLTGVRVLDLTRLLPGPFATRQLAALGAEVIKVEDPVGGDYARWYPPLTGDPPVSGMFIELNAGKKSVALDLKRPEAVEALRALALESDVLVDSFRPGVLARLGLDPRGLMEANPKLIYAAITGFGLDGPDVHRAGHDLGYQARAGVLDLGGSAEAPFTPGVQVADLGGAWVLVSGILAALLERARTGRGRVVDVSLTEAAMTFGVTAFGKLHAGEVPVRGQEMLDGSRPCYGIYQTKDGRHLAVGALEPKFWNAFLGALGLSELAPNALDGGESGAKARGKIQARLLERTRDAWTEVFRTVEACVEPVLTLEEAEADPQHVARGVLDAGGRLVSPLSARGARGFEPAPALGADTEGVLRALGWEESKIRALVDG